MHDDKRIISNQLDQDHLNAAIAIAWACSSSSSIIAIAITYATGLRFCK
jgi:hypothetical protein